MFSLDLALFFFYITLTSILNNNFLITVLSVRTKLVFVKLLFDVMLYARHGFVKLGSRMP